MDISWGAGVSAVDAELIERVSRIVKATVVKRAVLNNLGFRETTLDASMRFSAGSKDEHFC